MKNFAQFPVLLLLLTLIFVVVTITAQTATRFHVIRQWKYVNFTWPNEEVFKTAMAKGLYIPENNIIAGVKYYENFYYITLPRMKNGVPATLTRIPAGDDTKDTSPSLQPFPNWEMNSIDNCNSLQNVQNVEIDTKGQIWIIDGGRIETLMPNPVVKCTPKLIIFDIKNNRTTTVYNFPEDVAMKDGSFLYDLVVDNTDGGYAYITDNSGKDPGIIVYSVRENRSWKIRSSRTMYADSTATNFRVNDVMISAQINIAGIALGPKIHTSNQRLVVAEDREVYFSPLSSLHLYSINTTVLRNENRSKINREYQEEIKDIGMKASQTVGMIMDNEGILYYGLLGNNAIGRWDSRTSFQSAQKIIARDDKHIEWPNSFTFDLSGNLTLIMNRLNKFIYGKLDLNEPNFRLISANVGGKSYLYDENFDYHHSDLMTPQPEPSSTIGTNSYFNPSGSSSTFGPEPTAEPNAYHHHEHITASSISSQMDSDNNNYNSFKSSAMPLIVINLFYLIATIAILL